MFVVYVIGLFFILGGGAMPIAHAIEPRMPNEAPITDEQFGIEMRRETIRGLYCMTIGVAIILGGWLSR